MPVENNYEAEGAAVTEKPGGASMISRTLSRIALAVCALAGPAAAQTYPDKPIKLIVPYPPCGPRHA